MAQQMSLLEVFSSPGRPTSKGKRQKSATPAKRKPTKAPRKSTAKGKRTKRARKPRERKPTEPRTYESRSGRKWVLREV